MPVGIKDVAARAGVSLGTVSNVLNRPEVVAEPTRRRVLDAIAALGYVRNESARALRAGRSHSLGMVVLDIANPFFTDMARGAEEAALAADLTVILCNSANQRDRERRHLQRLEQQRVDGILLTPAGDVDAEISAVRRRGTPVVLVDQSAQTAGYCSVGVDDVLGGCLAVRHLLAQGHRRIAFVGGPTSLAQVRDRAAGYGQALSEAGLTRRDHVPTAELTAAAGAAAGVEIAGRTAGKRPTAVFCANDLLALGLLQEFTRRRVRVPEDVAIVGYDDIDFAATAAVPLSSVQQPREELGRAAAEMLVEEVRRRPDHRHRRLVFTPELVVRASSDYRRPHQSRDRKGARLTRPA